MRRFLTAMSSVEVVEAPSETAEFMTKFCLARAAECRRHAEQATDSAQQWSWLEMEGRWFFMARSYDNERRTDSICLRAS